MIAGSLAERLRVLRAQRGMTLVEAAEQAGVGRDTLSDLERSRRHPVMPTLAKIARGYGVPVEELLEEPALAEKAEAPDTGHAEAEQGDAPGVPLDVLSYFVQFTTNLADMIEAEVEGVERDRTFPYFAWDYRIEATISHLTQQLNEDGILAYVAEVREGHRLAQNEERRLAVALASNLSRLRHLAERAQVCAQILHVDSYVEGRQATARPVADVLKEWEETSAPDASRHD